MNSKYTKHHARSAVIQGQVDIKYISTDDNVSDVFTKPLLPVQFLKHRNTLGVVPEGE